MRKQAVLYRKAVRRKRRMVRHWLSLNDSIVKAGEEFQSLRVVIDEVSEVFATVTFTLTALDDSDPRSKVWTGEEE